MTKALLFAVLGISLLCAQAAAAAEAGVKSDLSALVEKLNAKIAEGVFSTEEDFATELKELDTIEASHAGGDSEALAEVLMLKAMLYLQVIDNPAKALQSLEELQKKYPGTKAATAGGGMVDLIEAHLKAREIRGSLKVGTPFPPFDVKDMAGNPFSLAAMKGKVVFVDFWATWCPPCIMELPFVLAAYEKYHDKGFEVAGISLDEDRGTLEGFLKRRGITWPQYFDGKGFDSLLAVKYGITMLPTTFLLDRNGVIIGVNLRGGELDAAVAKALEAK